MEAANSWPVDVLRYGNAYVSDSYDHLFDEPFAPHIVASFLGAMASAHVCASVPNFLILEWQSYFHTNPMFKEIVQYEGEWVKDSFITLSEKPGIGVEINEEAMKKYAIPGIPFFV
ncbi:MAG: enolase C-terminal domain-like protein [Flavihumibacter sp.]|nr:enolase C-terminal domain-like protein [Flavihumibacter sp.]